MAIIDVRVRPLYKSYGEGFDAATIKRFIEAWGYTYKGALVDRKMESLVEELQANEIVKAIVPGRISANTTNAELFEIKDLYPDQFEIFPFLDVRNTKQSLEVIENEIKNGRGIGASMEPFPLVSAGINFDDESIFPIYEKLEKEGIPVLTTVGGLVNAYVDNTIPAQINRVLNNFPNLKFIAAHSGWPWVNEMVVVAFRHPNLYLTADFEGAKSPGTELLRDATEHMLKDQMLFCSSFPLGSITEGVELVKSWKLPKAIEERVFYENAARLLNF